MSQFSDPNFAAPPPKKWSTTKWVIILLVVMFGGLLVCCGGPLIGLFMVGKGVLAEQIKTQYENHPAVKEHVGDNVEVTMHNITPPAEQGKFPNENVVMFDIKGSKGTGTVVTTMPPQFGAQGFNKVFLRTNDGKEIQLK